MRILVILYSSSHSIVIGCNVVSHESSGSGEAEVDVLRVSMQRHLKRLI